MSWVQPKPCAGDRVGELPCVLGRNRCVRGAVVHTRYDFLSFIRTLEIPIGMKLLGLADSLAVPLYDAFDSTPQNSEPYTAIPPNIPIDERNTAASPMAAQSDAMDFSVEDAAPDDQLGEAVWRSVRG